MATFIDLSGTRYNVDHIVQYWAGDHGGSRVMLSTMVNETDVTDRVDEPPEQIDALLGVTAIDLSPLESLLNKLGFAEWATAEGAHACLEEALKLYGPARKTLDAIAAAGGAK